MKKIIFIANIRLPTEKAHGIQIMKMCSAFSALGNEIELVVPWRFNPIKEDPFIYYGIEKNFKITKVPSLDLVKLGKIGFFIQTITFLISAKIYLLFRKYDILYTRESLAGLFFKDFVLELHTFPKKIIFVDKLIWKRAKALIVLTSFIKKRLVEAGVSESKILVAPDAVDLEKFNIKISKEEARLKVGLPQDKKIILYTGHLYDWKGATVLLEAAKQSQISNLKSQILFVLVGGTEKDVKKFKSQISNLKNIVVAGHRPHHEIPYWLKAADVLVLPNSAKEKISEFYTSPLKLFEYMAAKKPIVASDLLSIREILNDPSTGSGQGNAILVEPDNPQSLAYGIKKVLDNPELAENISEQAYFDVRSNTWAKRAENILEFIKKKKI